MLRTSSDPHYGGLDSSVAPGGSAHGAADAVTIPDAHLLYDGDFKRAGNDLILSDDKHKFVVHDYFKSDKHPMLLSPNGGAITPEVVLALAGSQAPGEYAQAGAAPAQAEAIGRVVKVTGNVVIIRNGVSITLNTGDAVLKGDVVQTGGDGSLAVTFTDGSTFDLGANARMVLSEFVYDPNGTGNTSVVNLVRGQLSFIAGQIAHSGDMKVVTPVATMGIRGTVGIMSQGDTLTLTVANEGDGQIHAIEIRDSQGNLIGRATSVGGTWQVAAVQQTITAQETARQLDALQELNIVSQLLNSQAIGQQLIQQFQQQLQDNTRSNEQHGTTIYSDPNGQKSQLDTGIKITLTSDPTKLTDLKVDITSKDTGGGDVVPPIVVPPSTNPAPIFITDGSMTRIAPATDGSVPGAHFAGVPDASADGRYVAFQTFSSNPAHGGQQTGGDIFLYDRQTHTLTTITDAAHMQAINAAIGAPQAYDGVSLSLDGNTVVFQGDFDNNHSDVYVYDRLTNSVSLLMPSGGNAHVDGSGHFITMEGHLATTQTPGLDVLLVARGGNVAAQQNGGAITFTTGLISSSNATVEVKIAVEHGTLSLDPHIDTSHLQIDGAGSNFITIAGTLDAVNNALKTGVVYNGSGSGADELTVTVDGGTFQSQGIQYPSQVVTFDAQGHVISSTAVVAEFSGASGANIQSPEINADGRYITFESAAQDLLIDGHQISTVYVNGQAQANYENTTGASQVYVYDQATHQVELISVSNAGQAGTADSGGDWPASISADGRYVTFQSDAALVAGDSNGHSDVYVYDRVDHTIERVSVASAPIDFAHTLSAEFQANTAAAGNQTGQSTAALKDGSYVVVWTSDAQNGGTSGIFAQRYDGDGHTLGGQIQIAAAVNGTPVATALSDGSYVVTWTSGDQGTVFAQRFAAGGTPVDAHPITVNDGAHLDQGVPSTTALANGGFAVAWASGGNIYGQMFDASGHQTGAASEFAVNTTTAVGEPVITALGNGGFLVVWTTASDGSADPGIAAQRFDATGAKVGQAFAVNTTTSGAQSDAAVGALSDGSLVVTWTAADGSIHGQHLSANGGKVGGEFTVTPDPGANSSVTGLADGGFLVTWTEGNAIHGQRFAADGTAVDTAFTVNSDAGTDSHSQAVTLASGGVVVTWQSNGPDGSGSGISGQLYTGALQSDADSYRPEISPDGRYVIFGTDAALVVQDTNHQPDTYIYDRWTQTTSLVSQTELAQLGLANQTIGNSTDTGGAVSSFGAVALAFGHDATATKQGSVITFANASLSDFNPDPGTVTLTLSVDHGTLAPVSGSGLTITHNPNGQGDSITATGTLAQVEAALNAGVKYTPASGYTGADTLTISAVDQTGDGTTETVSFDTALASPPTLTDKSVVSNVYVVDSSTGASGAVPDDSSPSGALTFTDHDLSFATSGQATMWIDPGHNNTDLGSGNLDPVAAKQQWGLVFTVPSQQSVLKALDVTLASAGGTNGATAFTIALYEWSNGQPVGNAIYTSAAQSLLSGGDFHFDGLNIPVEAGKQYVWQIVGDGEVSVATATGTADGTLYHQDDAGAWTATGTALAATFDFAPALTTSGVLPFLDVNDTHTVAVASHSGDWGNLVAWVSKDTTGGNSTGTINWSYEVDPRDAAALTLGETHTDTFTVTLTDSAGGTATRDVTVTVIGTNEVPQITSGPATVAQTEKSGATGDTSQADAHAAGGTFAFTDFNAAGVDTQDTHTVTASLAASQWQDAHGNALSFEDPHNADLLSSVALFGEVSNQQQSGATFSAWLAQDTSAGSGQVGWSFQLPDKAVDFLAEGETLTLTYNVAITDSHLASSTQTVTVTLTGTNDTPTITSNVQSGLVTEDADNAPGENADVHQQSGAITFTDVDLSDAETSSITKTVVTSQLAHGYHLTTAQQNALVNAFSIGAATHSTSDGSGSIGWQYTIDDGKLDFLGKNDVVTLTYTVQTSDGHGGTASQDVTVTVHGTEDTPVIAAQTQAATITEDGGTVGQGGESGPEAASGTINFTDVDLSDAETSSFTVKQVDAQLAHGDTLTTDQQNALVNAFSIGAATHSTSDGSGSIGWQYNVDDSALDFLGKNDVVTLTYTVQVDDGNGGTASQDVTITVQGTEDVPVIAAQTQAATITEDGGTVGQGGESGPEAASGTINFTDVDLSDAEASSFTVKQVDAQLAHGDTLTTDQQNALVNAFSIDDATHSTSDGSGTIGWHYNIDDSALDFLGANDQVTLTYTVQVDDGNGGTASQDVTITVQGTEDTPTITPATQSGAVTEDADGALLENNETHQQSGTINFTDVDLSDAETSSFTVKQVDAQLAQGDTLTTDQQNALVNAFSIDDATHSTSDGSGTIGWHYNIDDSALDFLGANDQVTLTYTVQVDDGNGGTASQDVTITVHGTEDAPAISATNGSITELVGTGNPDTDPAFGTITFTDVDQSDRPTVGTQFTSYDYLAADGTTPLTLNSPQQTAIEQALTLTPDSGNANNGSVGWSYSVADSALDFLDKDETLTLTYTATVDDHNGGVETTPVTVTIHGTNDAPTPVGDAVAVDEDATAAAATAAAGVLANDTDPDHGETATLTVSSIQSASVNGAPLTWLTNGTATVDGAYGTLTINSDGTYSYTPNNAAAEALAQDEQASDAFVYTASDVHGAASAASLTFNITGQNDAPVIDANATTPSASVTEDRFPAVTGQIAASDVDHNDTAAWSITGGQQVPGDFVALLDEFKATSASGVALDDNFDGTVPLSGVGSPYGASITTTIPEIDGRGILLGALGSNNGTFVSQSGTFTTPTTFNGNPRLSENTTFDVMGRYEFVDPDDNNELYGIRLTDRINSSTGLDTLELAVRRDPTDGHLAVQFRDIDLTTNQASVLGEVAIDPSQLAGSQIEFHLVHDTANTQNITAYYDVIDSSGHSTKVDVPGVGQIFTVAGEDWTRAQFIAREPTENVSLMHGQYGYLTVDQQGHWQYLLDDSSQAVQALAQDQHKTDGFDVVVTDSHGATATQHVSIDVVGRNDAPVITASGLSGSVQEDSNQHVADGGFESGDFNSWVVTGGNSSTTVDATAAHSGSEGADIGPNDNTVVLSQNVSTTAGEHYTLDFWLNPDWFVSSSTVSVSWDGQTLDLNQGLAQNVNGFNEYSFDVVGATGTDTALAFTFFGPDSNVYRHLDDVSVTGSSPLPQQSTAGLINFSDPDLTDTHSASFVADGTGYVGTFSLDAVQESNGQGTVQWHFVVDNSALQYLGAGETAQQSYDVSVSDGLQTATQTVTVTLTGANDAPVLSGTANSFTPITEDDQAFPTNPNNPGNTVASLLGSNVSDVDIHDADGIAITGADAGSGNGTWQYSINGVGAWTDVGSVSEGSALLLGANDLLRFNPDGKNGTTASISYHAWDGSQGTAGQTADLTQPNSTGGSTAFSTGALTSTIDVASVNDAPVVASAYDTPNSITLDPISHGNVDSAGATIGSLFAPAFIDVDTGASLAGYAIYGAPQNAGEGTWQWSLDDSHWNDIPPSIFGDETNDSVWDGHAFVLTSDTYVRFVPADGFTGQAADLTGRLVDNSSAPITDGSTYVDLTQGIGGTTPYSSAPIDIGETVEVNQAPSGADATITTAEDTPHTFTAADFGFSDPNDTPADSLLAVKIATLPDAGTLTDNGVAVTTGQTIDVADINNGLLKFTPAQDGNGTGYTSFTFQVEDNGGTAGGGTDLDQSPNKITVDVTAVNDAPVLSAHSNSVSFTANDAPVALLPDVTVTDPDNPVDFTGDVISASVAGAVNAPGDAIVLASGGPVTLNGSEVEVNGVDVGTFSEVQTNSGPQDPMPGASITLNGNATAADVNAILDALAYQSSAGDPTNGGQNPDRTVTVSFSDGGHDGSGSALSDSATVTVDVAAAGTGNAAPVVSIMQPVTLGFYGVADPITHVPNASTAPDVAYADGHVYVIDNWLPVTQTTSDRGNVVQFTVTPAGQTIDVSDAWHYGNLSGVAADANKIYAVGASNPGTGLTQDTVGGVEEKSILVRFNADGTPGNDPDPAIGTTSNNFFSYNGVEAFQNVLATTQNGGTILYAVGGGQPASYGAYVIAEYDSNGNLLHSAVDSLPVPGFSIARDAVEFNGGIWAVGGSWHSSLGESTNVPTVWQASYDLSSVTTHEDTVGGQSGDFYGAAVLGNNLYAVGNVSSNGGDYIIAKYDTSGDVVWSVTGGGSGADTLTGVVALDGHLFAVGTTTTAGGDTDGVLMEINPADGSVIGTLPALGWSQYDSANAITTDGTYLYIAGDWNSGSNPQGWYLESDAIGGGTATTAEDHPLTFNGITVTDADAGNSQIEVTLAVGKGTLSVDESGLDAGSTNDGATIHLFGSQTAIDVALKSGVVYTPDANVNGSDTLTVTADDQGHSGGSAQTGTQSIGIDVTAVNDAPVATAPTAHYAATDGIDIALQGTGLSVSDVDGGTGVETITLAVGEGIVTADAGTSGVSIDSGNGSGALKVSGTIDELNDFLAGTSGSTIAYNDNAGAPSASTTLTLTVDDNGNSGGGDLTAQATATIDITPANEPGLHAVDDTIPAAPSGDGWVLNPENGHYYRLVTTPTDWDDANSAAQADGAYLATITSAQENNFVTQLVANSGAAWAGGETTDDSPDGQPSNSSTWHWVEGPEAGTLFSYTNWNDNGDAQNAGEPNGGFGASVAGLQIQSGGTWNDVPTTPDWLAGYVEEWGGDTFSPVFHANGSTTFSTGALTGNDSGNAPFIVSVSSDSGNGGFVTLNNDNTITYVAPENFAGSDSFTYTIADGGGGLSTATVTLTVQGVADYWTEASSNNWSYYNNWTDYPPGGFSDAFIGLNADGTAFANAVADATGTSVSVNSLYMSNNAFLNAADVTTFANFELANSNAAVLSLTVGGNLVLDAFDDYVADLQALQSTNVDGNVSVVALRDGEFDLVTSSLGPVGGDVSVTADNDGVAQVSTSGSVGDITGSLRLSATTSDTNNYGGNAGGPGSLADFEDTDELHIGNVGQDVTVSAVGDGNKAFLGTSNNASNVDIASVGGSLTVSADSYGDSEIGTASGGPLQIGQFGMPDPAVGVDVAVIATNGGTATLDSNSNVTIYGIGHDLKVLADSSGTALVTSTALAGGALATGDIGGGVTVGASSSGEAEIDFDAVTIGDVGADLALSADGGAAFAMLRGSGGDVGIGDIGGNLTLTANDFGSEARLRAFGAMTIGDNAGSAAVTGDLSLSAQQGATADISTNGDLTLYGVGGAVTLAASDNGTAQIESASGAIALGDIGSDFQLLADSACGSATAEIQASGPDLSIGTIGGSFVLSATAANNFSQALASIDVSDGDVKIGHVAQDFTLATGTVGTVDASIIAGGKIAIDGIGGDFHSDADGALQAGSDITFGNVGGTFSNDGTIDASATLTIGTVGASPIHPANLIVNGGFETGDLSGWSDIDPVSDFASNGTTPFIGNYAAFLGEVGGDSALSQTITTQADHSYTLSFWLSNDVDPNVSEDLHNDFSVLWNGLSVGFSLLDAPAGELQQYTITGLTGAADLSTLEFDARNDPGYWHLDNVVLTDDDAPPLPGDFVNTGTISAGNQLSIGDVSGNFDNSGSIAAGEASVSIGAVGGSFANEGTIEAFTLSIAGSAAVLDNSGTLNVNATANLGVDVHDTGSIFIGGTSGGAGNFFIDGGQLTFGGEVDNSGVTFQSAGADSLALDDALHVNATLSGFAAGDTVDLANVDLSVVQEKSYVDNGSGTGGTLTLYDGSHTALASLTFSGSYTVDSFGLVNDGGSGTDIRFDHAPVANNETLTGDIAGFSYDNANGHWYQVVNDLQTWTDAAAAADAAGGYLPTITSSGENQFLFNLASAAGVNTVWLGASDDAAQGTTEGNWIWTAGPEAGQQFWQGAADGQAAANAYANWNGGEPNNAGGNENYAMMWGLDGPADGTWNDTDGANPQWYAVEVGITEDTDSVIPSAFLLANDTDADVGDTLSINSVDATSAHGGTVTLLADGNVLYHSAANYNGTDSFTYTVKDAGGVVSNTATVTFDVGAVNDPPVIDPSAVSTTPDDSASNFATITPTGTTTAWGLGINNLGDLVGQLGWELQGTTFSAVSYPGANFTVANDINDSRIIVGNYDLSGTHAFIDNGGSFSTIAVPTFTSASAEGINDAGVIVGMAWNTTDHESAFIDNGSSIAIFTHDAAATRTIAEDVNDAGWIVGWYADSNSVHHGFITYDDGSSFTDIDVPNAIATEAHGVNDLGEVVGEYIDSSHVTHGFLYDNGTFTTIDDPAGTGISGTLLYKINDSGEVIGTYGDNSNVLHAFTADTLQSVKSFGLTLSDVDAGSDPLTITASADHGTMALAQSEPDLTPDPNAPAGTLAASGTLDAINQMLADGVVYTPNASLPDNDKISVTIDDGHGGIDSVNFIFNVAGQTDGNGDISLSGTSGKDVIYNTSVGNNPGGTTDTLTGGAGADTFVFRNFSPQTQHNDVVSDFNVDEDFLSFDHTTFAHISDVLAAAQADPNNAANTVITVDAHNTVTLDNVTTAQLVQHQSHIIIA